MKTVVALLLVAALGSAAFLLLRADVPGLAAEPSDPKATWAKVEASEELILALDPQMKRLGFAMANLALPDFQSLQVFDDQVEWNDVTVRSAAHETFDSVGVSAVAWQVASEHQRSPQAAVKMWTRVLEQIDYWEHAKFYIIKGQFLTDARDQFETETGFVGLARLRSGAWNSLEGKLTLTWKRKPDVNGQPDWRVSKWTVAKFAGTETKHTLFDEVLDDVLPKDGDLVRARQSLHEQLVLKSFESDKWPSEHFSREAFDHHPGVAVVDLDQDGFDDFYVMERWGKNLFFRNNGNSTFTEVAANLGLDIDGHTSSAIFADFDNDGDKDVVLGRTLAPSMYLENQRGRFVDRSAAALAAPLPGWVSSVSVTDYDGDGLLDVYFSTYASQYLNRHPEVGEGFLPDDEAAELRRLMTSKEAHKYLNLPGPPNVLLRNLGGGRFQRTDREAGLRVFKNTYQSTWGDYDGDGDQDVYLANDFSTHDLFRNEGNGKFVDVSESTGTTDLGFGMGASWGDYDNDGRQDLYVSNMYSKAGRRITAQLDYLDPRVGQMARGNSLFHNEGERFTQVAGEAPPAMLVEKGGWSWGSQFMDVDNDGFLDIFSLDGYYTSPKEDGLPDL
jgi:hypothetical protein